MDPLHPPFYLDHEPPVFWGCTTSELGVLAAAGFILSIPIALGLMGMLGFWFMAVPLAGGITLLTIRLGSARLRLLKRNRPPGFYNLKAKLLFQDLGLRRRVFIRHCGPWWLGRPRTLKKR